MDLSDEEKRDIDIVMDSSQEELDRMKDRVPTGDNSGREYRYQKDWSLGSTMYHVRCDDWEDFKKAVNNIETEYLKRKTISKDEKPLPWEDKNADLEDLKCTVCSSPLLPEVKTNPNKTTGKVWWVRRCSNPAADFQHNKDGGTIRPAS